MDHISSAGQLSVRMRTGLPTPLALALEDAHSRMGDEAVRLGRRLAFLDGLLRFLVAVQEIEREHLGLPRPVKTTELISRLEKTTFGMWLEAARALARCLESSPRRPLPAVGLFLLDEAAPATRGCSALIAIRNEYAHSQDLFSLPHARAAEMLARSDGPWRDLVRGLDPLCSLVMVQNESARKLPSGRIKIQVSLSRGTASSDHNFELDDDPLPMGCPALLASDGTLLATLPWLANSPPSSKSETLLLRSWSTEGPVWTTFLGQTGLPAVAGELTSMTNAAAWIQANTVARSRTLPGEAVQVLLREPEVEQPPRVRSLTPIRRLGRGGTGVVWLVEDRERGSARSALKILHPMLATQREQRERLRREFQALRSVQVRGVVQVVDFFEDDEYGACLQMEYVEGESLQARLNRGPIPEAEALACVRTLLDTLHVVHERGIVHRDLKPSNILLENGRPRLIDFGVARLSDAARLTATADMVGTVRYAAPEQFTRSDVGPSADLYSLGTVLREMLLGFDADGDRLSDLSPGLQRVLARATQADPSLRFASASEMAIALGQANSGAFDGAALMPGDRLPGGLTVRGQLAEVAPGFYLLSTQTRDGKPVAVLTSGPARADRERFRERIEAIPGELKHQQGCGRVLETELHVPYVELLADASERRARQLLHPETSPPPTPPPRDPGPAGPAVPLDRALGALFSASGPPPTTLGRQTPSTDLAERCHHLGVLLLGLEAELGGLSLTEQHWRSAWGTRYGGLSMLLSRCDRGAGPFSRAALSRSDREALLRLIPELARSKGALTPPAEARLRTVWDAMEAILLDGARRADANAPLRQILVRHRDDRFEIRRAKATDGWWAINLGA